MEASSGRSRVRPIVVDFLATLLVTFCIGVAAAVVLGACAMLMAGEARGAEPGELAPMPKMDAAREGTRAEETRAKATELTLTHHLVTKYASLIAIERTPARPVNRDADAPAASVFRRCEFVWCNTATSCKHAWFRVFRPRACFLRGFL